MKGKEIKSHHVPTDEPYVENLNLVTGDKFNYDKPLIVKMYSCRLKGKSNSYALTTA